MGMGFTIEIAVNNTELPGHSGMGFPRSVTTIPCLASDYKASWGYHTARGPMMFLIVSAWYP